MNEGNIINMYSELFDEILDSKIINLLMDYNMNPPALCLELESPNGERSIWKVKKENQNDTGWLERV